MKRFTLAIAATISAMCMNLHALADHLSSRYLFSARLDGAQQVPAVTTNALGVATFNLSANRDTLCIEGTFNGLSGPITGIHIHEAAAGANGGVIVDLVPYTTGNLLKATITGATLTPAFIQKMFSGMYYLNVHTAANPNGEIRGQIVLESDLGMLVKMDGSQQNPAVVTNAKGMAFFWLAQHQGKLSFRVVFDGLSGPVTGAHLHKQVAGQNGGVIQDLMPYLSGNTIIGEVDPTPYLNALLSDSLYINVHTAANPGGEIRGQLVQMPYLYYDAWMTGSQEVPPVSTNAVGLTVARINYTFDTLWYDMQTTGLSGAITAAHYHKGALGQGGGVLLPFTGVATNSVSGFAATPQLSDSFINFLNEGNIYANAHTAANGGGEIRGQAYRVFREGYTYHIDGTQQVPAVSTSAYGTGMVSIDRDQTNAHFMTAVTGLTPNNAHFHQAIPGQSGGVIYPLFSLYSNGGIFGYWKDNDPNTPFNSLIANKFQGDSVYINYHTTANPNGEIRGNVGRELCNATPNTLANITGSEADIEVYPNPAQSSASLRIKLSRAATTNVELTDMMGRRLWMSYVDLHSGTNNIKIPLNNIASGVYMLNVTDGEHKNVIRLIKE